MNTPSALVQKLWNYCSIPREDDESLEESANLPAPEIIALEITDDLEAALEQFATITEDLK